ncbi:MAG: methylated-DNA--[protein]-cysteine S-methyltransferase [Alphaproteobacteria bacterium]|nr:methylated-DNA--[protein]-cysteine S-methyltransferase [Alphaproteobacteria bacterium]
MARLTVDSPFGPLTVTEDDAALIALDWHGGDANTPPTPLLAAAQRQLAAYFRSELKDFDLPVAPRGSAHDRSVWRAMCAIPWGETRNYGEVARDIASSPRAVGGACGANPLPILVPCHRILAAGGRLGGYSGAGGGATKRALLALEGHPVQFSLLD